MGTSIVPPPQESFSHDLVGLRQRIDQRLAALLPVPGGESDLIGAAMVAAALSPGKRVRPMLLVLAARELGAPERSALDLGCALEMVHAASLVLDDMPCMDDARLRRGEPTIHVRYGQDVAVLAVVGLLSQAFKVVALAPGLPPAVRPRLVALLGDAVGEQGLVRGQFEDLHAGCGPREASEVTGTNQLKTGALFGAALEMAALAASASESVLAALRDMAMELGQAFQLYDDLCDGEPDADPGKDQGKDTGKATLVALLGAEAARHRLRQHVQRVENLLEAVYGPESGLLYLLGTLFPRVG
ncbi:polyprenyl synthetase family protein [Stutzerimonas tarimensis]|uniref:Polyprenyl synthetase family protein n=1 Tax=Stutzerimonas tarimensis TaxID=1507735 RepID=A0ABV7T2L6_9GAMM